MLKPLIALLLIAVTTTVWAGDDPKVGETVSPRFRNVTFGDTGTNGQLVPKNRKYIRYAVREVSGEWMRVENSPQEAWVKKVEWVRMEDAPSYYTTLIRQDAKDTWAWRLRAYAWEGKGETDNAIKDYTEAIRLDPNLVSSLVILPLASYVGVVAPLMLVISFCLLAVRVWATPFVVTVLKFPNASYPQL